MENNDNIILFAKEVLRQGPSRSMLKIYMLGSTLAMLGMIGGMVESLFLPSLDGHVTEEEQAEFFLETKKKRKEVLKLRSTLVHTEAEGMMGVVSEAKAKRLAAVVQRSSANRIHAS